MVTKFYARTDMPMIQTRVTRKEALKFADRMNELGWTAVSVKSSDGVDVHFTNTAGETSIDYSVTVGKGYAYIGIRPQFPTEA